MSFDMISVLARVPSRNRRAGLIVRAFMLLLFMLLIGSMLMACISQSDDDTGGNPADDDAVTDDDADDDASADDDDDVTDDDTDDDSDDDTDIYDDLNPTGLPIGEILGISSHMAGGSGPSWERDFEIEKLQEAGINCVRRDFLWSFTEPQDDVWNWDDNDGLYDNWTVNGFRGDALIDYGVDWAMPGGSHSEIPPAEFAEYAGNMATRYCEGMKDYEIWNEENNGGMWKPEPDPAHYGELLKASYTAIKATCPDANVIFGGLAASGETLPLIFDGLYYYFDQVIEAHPDICDYFDTMSIHPYTADQQPWPELNIQIGPYSYPSMIGQNALIRQRMADAGCGDKPLVWTEFGWPSLYIGKQNQARFMARALLLGAMDGVQGMYIYTFWDGRGASPPTEDTFGLFEYPYDYPPGEQVPKPNYLAVQTLSNLLCNARYAGDLSAKLVLPRNVYALAFLDDTDRLIITGWDGSGYWRETTLSLPAPPGYSKLIVRTIDGTVLSTQWSDPINLTLNGDVLYLEFLP